MATTTTKEDNKMASNIEITVRYTESDLIEVGAKYNSFEAFQAALNVVATGAPEGGAYDKIGYRMILTDINFDLSGRVDIHHTSYGNVSFVKTLPFSLRRSAEILGSKASKAVFLAAAAYVESYAG